MTLQMINEVARGEMSAASRGLLQSACRELPEHVRQSAVHLFATNVQVEAYNTHRLLEVSG